MGEICIQSELMSVNYVAHSFPFILFYLSGEKKKKNTPVSLHHLSGLSCILNYKLCTENFTKNKAY